VLGEPLLRKIRERAAQGPASFLIISPQGDSDGSYEEAERRLLRAVTTLRSEALDVHGQISHPDPYSAVMQTLEDERVNEIIVSTFRGARSGWLRRDLLGRLRADTKLPIDHIEVDMPAEVTAR
jgi:GABA permease